MCIFQGCYDFLFFYTVKLLHNQGPSASSRVLVLVVAGRYERADVATEAIALDWSAQWQVRCFVVNRIFLHESSLVGVKLIRLNCPRIGVCDLLNFLVESLGEFALDRRQTAATG